MVGERLKLARGRVGLSLRELAERVDGLVSAQAIGKYERGEMEPSARVLAALARALEMPLAYFHNPLGVELDGVEFRKKAGTTKRDRMRVETEVLRHVEAYLLIEEVLELDSAAWSRPLPRPQKLENLDQAEDLATRVRKEWRLGRDPISDMTELLEEHGIKVLILELPRSVSGLTCTVRRPRKRPPVPVIVVNQAMTLERRRLTLAHELAHRLMDPTSAVDIEKAATRFAGAFMVPAEHLRAEIGQERHGVGYRELIDLKQLYGISGAALLVRLRDLDVISQSTLAYAFQTFARAWRGKEPEPLEEEECRGQIEMPRRFERFCYRALTEGLISLAKTAELLQRPTDQIEAEVRGPAV